jgi:hypothetical protein
MRSGVILDPLFFLMLIFGGFLPVLLISVLQQNNPLVSGKSTTIVVMGIAGLAVTLALAAVKKLPIHWQGWEFLLNRNVGLLVVFLLGATWISQYLVFAGTSVSLGIVDVLQAKLFYGGVGVFEELFFGMGLLLVPNALVGSKYFAAWNSIAMNPAWFGIYHLEVLPAIGLLYVIVPRLVFNLVYLVFPVPSAMMLTHFTWNAIIASTATISVLSLAGLGLMGVVPL